MISNYFKKYIPNNVQKYYRILDKETPHWKKGMAGVGIAVSAIFYLDYKNRKSWEGAFQRSLPENLATLKNRVCVPILISGKDHNHALDFLRSNIEIGTLESGGVVPLARTIHAPHEVHSVLSQLSRRNKIPIVILVGHGNSDSIEMGGGMLYARHLASAPVSGNAHIILFSCSTGKEKGGPSLARKISGLNPNVLISAANRDVLANTLQSYISFDFSQKGEPIARLSMRDGWGNDLVVRYRNGILQK